ncbi:hypothetical protein niasHT_024044 [Heterodera trifolii]|uniref:Ubiquitin-like domain-containing protein n=1 Tax=Heterodera trifolii TaxID=157864 RepID=A0ABD2KQH0_9BILA
MVVIRFEKSTNNLDSVDVPPNTTIGQLRLQIEQMAGVHPNTQRVLMSVENKLTPLDETQTVGAYGFTDGRQVLLRGRTPASVSTGTLT